MKTKKGNPAYCCYCEMPVDKPPVILSSFYIKLFGLKITGYHNYFVHKECAGHFRAEKQSMFLAHIAVILGIISLILGAISLI